MLKSYNVGLEKELSGLGWRWLIRPIAEYVMLPAFQFIHSFVPNYGLVIIIFSVLLKLLLNPLTASSMKSMKKMQALQPMMNEIKKSTRKIHSTVPCHSPVMLRPGCRREWPHQHHGKGHECAKVAHAVRTDAEEHDPQRPGDAHEDGPEPVAERSFRDDQASRAILHTSGQAVHRVDQVVAGEDQGPDGVGGGGGAAEAFSAACLIGSP